MLIALIVILVLASNCNTVDDPPPIGCGATFCGTDCSDPFPFSSCDTCPPGTVDVTFCPPTSRDAGPDGDVVFPSDASCDAVPCVDPVECVFGCEDDGAFYVGCCECPSGSFDREAFCTIPPPDDAGVDAGPPGLLALGEACFDDRQCLSGLCYGDVDASGAFGSPTCQASCLAPATTASFCLNDRHCCEGTCCIGCGEREGLCLTDTPPPPPPPAP